MDNKKPTSKSILVKLGVLTVIVTLLCIFCWYNNSHIVITEYEYTNTKLSEASEGYCIVHISDLHNAEFGKNNFKLINAIQACKPDIIVITGDIADGSTHTNIEKAVNFAKQAVTICPVYYVTGNHEYYLSKDKYNTLITGLTDAGVTVLKDEHIQITEEINLIGIDDNSLGSSVLSKLTDSDSFNLVLAHEPQYIKKYAQSDANLVLCGHAHGGQFRLPIIGAVVAPDQGFNPQYTEGLYNYNNTDMIVSRGLGNSAFPLRLFNYPEVVCIKFSTGY